LKSLIYLLVAVFGAGAAQTQPIKVTQSLQVHGYWQTDDDALQIEITECEQGGSSICGFVHSLPGVRTVSELARHADELCGFPLLFNLKYESDKLPRGDGNIFDPETEQIYSVNIQREDDYLKVRAFGKSEWLGETLRWSHVNPPGDRCSWSVKSK